MLCVDADKVRILNNNKYRCACATRVSVCVCEESQETKAQDAHVASAWGRAEGSGQGARRSGTVDGVQHDRDVSECVCDGDVVNRCVCDACVPQNSA